MARAIYILPFGRYNVVEELIEKECPIPAEAVGIRRASLYSHLESKQAILAPSSQTHTGAI